ncbi:hypothetical protein LCGC14_1407680 [marine sediment metagenome]|uniref:Uncharacterized protein n=1 Tax=marine sediment metagenome TaxID=412755 RepID=A0A0F9MAG3_9ZZZZ
MASLEERLDELETRLDMLYDMCDLHCEGTNKTAHKLDLLERYTVKELESCRESMYTWVGTANKNMTEFREELYKRKVRKDGV